MYSWTSPKRPPWRHKKVAGVERFKQESMYGLSAKKSGHCREVTVVERWPLLEVRLYLKQVSDHRHENELKIIKFSLTFLTSFFLTLLTGIRTRSRTAKGIRNFRPVNSSHEYYFEPPFLVKLLRFCHCASSHWRHVIRTEIVNRGNFLCHFFFCDSVAFLRLFRVFQIFMLRLWYVGSDVRKQAISEIKQRRFWGTYVNRNWAFLSFNMPWRYQICMLSVFTLKETIYLRICSKSRPKS